MHVSFLNKVRPRNKQHVECSKARLGYDPAIPGGRVAGR
jgi:hypothetical protein